MLKISPLYGILILETLFNVFLFNTNIELNSLNINISFPLS